MEKVYLSAFYWQLVFTVSHLSSYTHAIICHLIWKRWNLGWKEASWRSGQIFKQQVYVMDGKHLCYFCFKCYKWKWHLSIHIHWSQIDYYSISILRYVYKYVHVKVVEVTSPFNCRCLGILIPDNICNSANHDIILTDNSSGKWSSQSKPHIQISCIIILA